jgi:hypothetical protein
MSFRSSRLSVPGRDSNTGKIMSPLRKTILFEVDPLSWIPNLYRRRYSPCPDPYPPESREQMVDLVGAGRTPEELAREFEPIDV